MPCRDWMICADPRLHRPAARGGRARSLRGAVGLASLCFAATLAAAEDYSFDLEAFEKRPLEWRGYFELRQEHLGLREGSAGYRLNFGEGPQRTVERTAASTELSADYRAGPTRLSATARALYLHEGSVDRGQTRLYEGYFAHQAAPRTLLEAGKRTLKWGKGYAFNPVAFFERPKDPLEPELSREGFVLALADVIHTPGGGLHTLAFTPLLLPTGDALNEEFGSGEHLNPGAKLYLLYRNVDIDLLYRSNGSRPAAVGADFSANLASHWEIHGEWAYTGAHRQTLLTDAGLEVQERAAHSVLLGTRYLTEAETTWIVEYLHDGRGYSAAQMEAFFGRIDAASPTELSLLRQAAQQGYLRPNAMQDYLYVRASQKDAFDVLYFTPAVTAILNLEDGSYSLSPELLFAGQQDLELRLRASWLGGGAHTEFGEKPNRYKVEARVRWYF